MADTSRNWSDGWVIKSSELRLFLISFLILFFELICIRWIPAHVRYLSYFTNFILLACFLGIGIGCLSSNRKTELLLFFPLALLILVAAVYYFRFEIDPSSVTEIFFQGGTEYLARKAEYYFVLPVCFIFVTVLLLFLSQQLGLLLKRFSPIKAYTLNIGGSLLGIAFFALTSYLCIEPVYWFLTVFVILIVLFPFKGRLFKMLFAVNCMIMGLCVVLVFHAGRKSLWSPYYKIDVHNISDGLLVSANNTHHQIMVRTDDPRVRKFYTVPYQMFKKGSFEKILVVGAGGGMDVAFALENGGKHVDAVEIDPVIMKLGETYHPNRPYSDPRVSLHVQDARSFLKSSDEKYDLILYGLPDSLTLTSGFSSLRLESYLFTREAFEDVREHLTDDGLFVLYNFFRKEWLVYKISKMLESVFQMPTGLLLYDETSFAAVLLTGPKINDVNFASSSISTCDVDLATDDWPFLYLKKRSLPRIYSASLLLIAVIGLIFLFFVKKKPRLDMKHLHFFFLGSAFMLLETIGLIRFSLLFGSTWLVNSLVFFAILTAILIANLIVYKVKIKNLNLLYLFLFGILLLNFLVPLRYLLFSSPQLRYLAGSIFIFAPIFLANIIFSRFFKDTTKAEISFSMNLLGAFCGGMCEYLSMKTGYRTLFLLVAVFYLASFLSFGRFSKRLGA